MNMHLPIEFMFQGHNRSSRREKPIPRQSTPTIKEQYLTLDRCAMQNRSLTEAHASKGLIDDENALHLSIHNMIKLIYAGVTSSL
jgi:hypothetical protein